MKPLAWSHSALSDFLNCPKAYCHKRIIKDVVDPPNDAGLAGDYMHKQFEAFLKHGTPLATTYPEDIRDWPTGLGVPASYQEYLESLQRIPGTLLAENKYAITVQMQPCDFFAEDVWCRGILDIIILNGSKATVLDHKTGKRKDDKRQLKLAALLTLIHHPEVDEIKTGYVWLKDVKVDAEAYTREQEADLWREFSPLLAQYRQAFKTGTFVPRPSGLCNGWCPVQDCEFWKPKRSR